MRNLTLILFLMCTFAFAQNSKVFPKGKIVPGEANTFVYQPAVGFNVPNDAFVKYLTPVNYRKTPLKKVKNIIFYEVCTFYFFCVQNVPFKIAVIYKIKIDEFALFIKCFLIFLLFVKHHS